MLWELVCLKKPFAKYKYRTEFEEAFSRVDTLIVINQRWPEPIQDIISRKIVTNENELVGERVLIRL
jgi:hypothetical protein